MPTYKLKRSELFHEMHGSYTNESMGSEDKEKIKMDQLAASVGTEETTCKKGITKFGATVHFVAVMMSVNPLTMPTAFRSLGLVFSLLAFLTVGCLSTYASLMLSYVSNHFRNLDRINGRTLSEIAHRSLQCLPVLHNTCVPKFFATTISIIILLNLLSVATLLVTFAATNIKQVLLTDYNVHIEWKFLILPLGIVLGIMGSLRNPRNITPLSVIGTSCIIFGVVGSLIMVTKDLISQGPGDLEIITGLGDYSAFLGVAVFALASAILVVPIENTMTEPEKMHQSFSAILATMVITSTIFLTCGLIGYVTYGTTSKAQLNFHLKKGSSESIAIQILMATGFILSTPVVYGAVTEQILSYFPRKPSLCVEHSLRLLVVAFTLLLPALTSDVVKVIQWLSPSLVVMQYQVPPIITIAAFWMSWTIKQKIIQALFAAFMISFSLIALVSAFQNNN